MLALTPAVTRIQLLPFLSARNIFRFFRANSRPFAANILSVFGSHSLIPALQAQVPFAFLLG
jgi:hypothetical protein